MTILIKINQQLPAFEIEKPYGFAILIGKLEFRGLVAGV